MSSLRKLKRKANAPKVKAERKEEKRKTADSQVFSRTLAMAKRAGHRTQDNRVIVMLAAFCYVMHYELKVPIEKLREIEHYISEFEWFLQYSYDAKGRLTRKPSVVITEVIPQIWREKRYRVNIRTAGDMQDEIWGALVKALVRLELKLLWIVVDKFQGFGKVRLGRLQKRMFELERDWTYEECQAVLDKMAAELNFHFDKLTEQHFGRWCWNPDEPRLRDEIVDAIGKGRMIA